MYLFEARCRSFALLRRFVFLFLFLVAVLLGISLYGSPTAQEVSAESRSTEFPINSEIHNQANPAVTWHPDNEEFLIVWESQVGDRVIEGQRLSGNGALIGEVLSIADEEGIQTSPTVVARENSSEYLVAWIDGRNLAATDLDVYAQLIRSGTLVGPNQPINAEVTRALSVSATYCPSGASYLLAWNEAEQLEPSLEWVNYVYGRQVDATGFPAGDIMALSADLPKPGLQQISPALVSLPLFDQIFVVFRDARNAVGGSGNNDDIFGQFIDCEGSVLHSDDIPVSTQYSGRPRGNKQNEPAVAFNSNDNQLLAVWHDARNDDDASGFDTIDIYGQLMLPDGRPMCNSPNFNFEITTAEHNQQDVQVAYSPDHNVYMVIWNDFRNGNGDIYARLISPFGGLLREEIIISDASEDQLSPAITYHPPSKQFFIVWEDYRNSLSSGADIYGAFYQPPLYESYLPVISSIQSSPGDHLHSQAEIWANCWLQGQAVSFPYVEDIPGFDTPDCPSLVNRYKENYPEPICQPATAGKNLVSFDYCNYGSMEQQNILGRYGRSATYDQAVAVIAMLMSHQHQEAREILDQLGSYQNWNTPLVGAANGSFGFSFSSVGCPQFSPENRDPRYDANYLRNGAISWAGYAFVLYQRATGDDRYELIARRTADYLLSEQIALGTEGCGEILITGGYGRYDANNQFSPVEIDWVSTEHNIDAYFFLRDLGELLGEDDYACAASAIKQGLLTRLWAGDHFLQGLGSDGQDNPDDALDVNSWGAIFLLAVGEDAKAQQALSYVEQHFTSTVEGISGYEPYGGVAEGISWDEIELVWSEGSLGVAMAYVKSGNIDEAQLILHDMSHLQEHDPAGGLFYALHDQSEPVANFPEVPSVGGSGWQIMVLRALRDAQMRDLFWGPDSEM